ncbi:MAG TPA: hypothetical protein VKE22_26840 [Haliangiales bacterium]|nr:hypothetical protein [Haliangiales bacterium]
MRLLVLVTIALVLPLAAAADTSITALGSAPIAGGDVSAARLRSLDDAFRQAAEQSLAAFLDAPTRAKLADALQKRILRRAKGYIPQFKILSEGESEGVYHVQIEAQVADARLRADVRALGAAGPATEPDVPPPPAARRPKLVLLARAGDGTTSATSFGAEGDLGPAIPPLAKEIEAQGFELTLPRGLGLAPSEGRYPVDSAQAIAAAQKLGAGGAVVAGIDFRAAGRIRGTRLLGAEATVSVRVDDPSGRVGEVSATGAGYGETADQAAAAAVRDAAARIGRELAPRLAAHWPDERPAGEGVDVRVRGASKWPDVEAVKKGLGAAPGVRRVFVAGLLRREVVLHVSGAVTPRGLAGALGGDPRIAVTASGREIVANIQPSSGQEVRTP